MKKTYIKEVFPICFVLFILGLIFAKTSLVNANEPMLSDNALPIESFKQKYGSDWLIRWNDVTDTPHSIIGSSYNLDVGLIDNKEKAETVSTDFLFENSDLFKINNDNLRLLSVEQGNDEWYIEYQQYYQDLIVFNGKAFVTLSNNGELISVGSDIYSDVYVGDPSLNKDDAIQLAKNNFNNASMIDVKKALLIIYPKEDSQYYTVWDVQLFSDSPLEGREYFIDSLSGNIISEQDLIVSSEGNEPYNNNDYGKDGKRQTIFLPLGLVVVIVLVLLVLYRYNKNGLIREIKK